MAPSQMGKEPLSLMRTIARPRTPSRTASGCCVLALRNASQRQRSQGWRRCLVRSRLLSEAMSGRVRAATSVAKDRDSPCANVGASTTSPHDRRRQRGAVDPLHLGCRRVRKVEPRIVGSVGTHPMVAD